VVEHFPVHRRQIQRRPTNRGEPRCRPPVQPPATGGGVSAFDDVEELPVANIHDLGRPRLGAVAAKPGEKCFVETQSSHRADPVRPIDQSAAVGHDCVHHCVPLAAKIGGDARHGSAVPADLLGHPPASTRRHPATRRANLDILVGPAAPAIGATPPLLTPRQLRRPPEHREIRQTNDTNTMTGRRRPAPTVGSLPLQSDRDLKPAATIADTQNLDRRQANKKRAHARRIGLQQGLQETGDVEHRHLRRAPVPRP